MTGNMVTTFEIKGVAKLIQSLNFWSSTIKITMEETLPTLMTRPAGYDAHVRTYLIARGMRRARTRCEMHRPEYRAP